VEAHTNVRELQEANFSKKKWGDVMNKKPGAFFVIADWKWPILERHLSQASYICHKFPGLTPDTLLLYIETQDLKALGIVIMAANNEAAKNEN
jgi:hypothetical protein